MCVSSRAPRSARPARRQSLRAAEQVIILPPDAETRSRAHFTHALLIHAINYINHTLNGKCYLSA